MVLVAAQKSWLLTAIFVVVCATAVLGQTLPSSSAPNGPIRLWRNGVTSSSFTSGRVQLVFNRLWGNICGDAWFGITEATVICHQLGYSGASSHNRANNDTFGYDANPAVINRVRCHTSEYLVILQCSYSDAIQYSCFDDDDDVSVDCYSTRIWDNPFLTQVRLTGGDTVNQGLVEVYCYGKWGTVRSVDKFKANIICRQLGYYGAYNTHHLSIKGNSSQPSLSATLPCRPPTFYSCFDSCLTCQSIQFKSDHLGTATVECYSVPGMSISTTTSDCVQATKIPKNGPIRLYHSNGATSSSYTSGRVILVYNGQWGNICGDVKFGITEANVICHQLGYTGASRQSRASIDIFGIDSNPAVLSSVDCSTSEYLVILQCRYDSTPPSSCTDEDDVSVQCYTNRIWENPYSNQVRLTGGYSVNEGVVELYEYRTPGPTYYQHVWRASFQKFTAGAIDTICRQLGYTSAFNHRLMYIRQPFSSSLGEYSCSSLQSCIADCSIRYSSQSSSYIRFIYIECHSSSSDRLTGTTTATCVNAAESTGPIRLWRHGSTSSTYTSGQVQLVYNRQWGNICGGFNFGTTEATVICHQLGYTGASSWSLSNGIPSLYGIDNSTAVISDVNCSTSEYLVIFQCSYDDTPPSSCTDNTDVSVQCYSTRIWDNPYSGQVRLTGGSTVNQGLVEVYCNGQWGTVCRNSFGLNESDTICRQLGYFQAMHFNRLRIQGNSSQPIWLDGLPCTSVQSCIASCSNCSSSEDCSHNRDVTIECHSPFKATTTINTCNNETIIVGTVIGGTIGGIVIIFIIIIIIIIIAIITVQKVKCKQQTRSQTSTRIQLSTVDGTITSTTTTTTTATTQPPSQPLSHQPQQPPVGHSMPQPKALGSMLTYNQPSNPTITEAPPPAYGVHEKYTTYTEKSYDLPPPTYQPPSYNMPGAQYPSSEFAYHSSKPGEKHI